MHHSLLRRLWQDYHIHLLLGTVLLLLIALAIGASGGFYAHDRLVELYGNAGVIQPPPAAQKAAGAVGSPRDRGLGFRPSRTRTVPGLGYGAVAVPLAVDLSRFNPPVGNQGRVESCVSWSLGYYLRSWYAARDGHPLPGSGAAMYLYSQVSGGRNVPTLFGSTLALLHTQGVDSRAHYGRGDQDYWDRPTSADYANASHWHIADYHTLFAGQGQGSSAQRAIEQSMAAGNPVVLGIPVYGNFYTASPGSYYIDGIAGAYYGGHAVFASKYDANGVWIENQWGTSWGLNGWVELSWTFIQRSAYEADAISVPLARHMSPVLPHGKM